MTSKPLRSSVAFMYDEALDLTRPPWELTNPSSLPLYPTETSRESQSSEKKSGLWTMTVRENERSRVSPRDELTLMRLSLTRASWMVGSQGQRKQMERERRRREVAQMRNLRRTRRCRVEGGWYRGRKTTFWSVGLGGRGEQTTQWFFVELEAMAFNDC